MRVTVSTQVDAPPRDVFRLLCDMEYLINSIDDDVVSVRKRTEGPIGVGTRWVETISVRFIPGLKVGVELELTEVQPERLVQFSFRSKIMSGTGVSTCEASEHGSLVAVNLVGSTHLIGRIFYPFAWVDFSRRETRRIKAFKRKVESGELAVEKAARLSENLLESSS